MQQTRDCWYHLHFFFSQHMMDGLGEGGGSYLLIFSDLASHCRPRPPSTERAGAMCGRHEVAEWALAEPQTDRGPFQFAFVSRAWNALGAPGLKPWS